MYIGIDIGGTNLKIGILDENLQLIHQSSQPTNAGRGKDSLLERIENIITNLLSRFPDIVSAGIGIPGVVSDGIVKIAPNLPGWRDVPIVDHFYDVFDIPIYVDNDANMAAIAELELGAGTDLNNFIYVTLGTGVGGAIVINGKVYEGESGGAGEIGHLIIEASQKYNPRKPYRTGIMEEFIGRNQITSYAFEVIKKHPGSLLNRYDRPDPFFISEAVFQNDFAAIKIFKKIGEYLGIGIASAMNLLDIHVAIIGGGISQAHELLLDTARQTLKDRSMPTIAAVGEIRKAQFTKDAGIIGAALYGKNKVDKLSKK